MQSISSPTVFLSKKDLVSDWLLIDASRQVLGRLSSRVAYFLQGKHKSHYVPHMLCGDNVIVINASKVHLTGKKRTDKTYIRHTGYPGGQRTMTAKVLLERHPVRVIEHAVRGMLAKNRLGRAQYRRLYVYADSSHPHKAQTLKETKVS